MVSTPSFFDEPHYSNYFRPLSDSPIILGSHLGISQCRLSFLLEDLSYASFLGFQVHLILGIVNLWKFWILLGFSDDLLLVLMNNLVEWQPKCKCCSFILT